jgi:DNA invertase Pin-like site-specific DNA recombinase
MKTLALYYRVSTAPQDTPDKDSIPSQRVAGRAFAVSKDVPYKEYHDVYSGGKPNRKDFDRLSEDIEAGVVDAVWIRDVDRLARDVYIGSGLIKLLEENKGILFIGEQRVDPSNYQEVLLPNIGLAIAQYERGAIRARTLRGRKASINKGNRVSHDIYGYDAVFNNQGKRILVENEPEGKVVRHVFSLYQKGNSFKHIAKLLNDENIPTKFKKSSWAQSHISNMLRKPEYVAFTWNFDRTNLVKATYVPAILSMKFEEWKNLLDSIDQEAAKRNRNHYKLTYHYLSGLVKCSKCGAPYYFVHSNRYGTNYYNHYRHTKSQRTCKMLPTYVRAEPIERVFEYCSLAVFAFPLETEAYVQDSLKEIERKHQDSLLSLADISTKINQIQKAIDNLLESVELHGNYPDTTQRLKTRRAEKALLENTLSTMKKANEADKRDWLEVQMAFSMTMLERLISAKDDGRQKRNIYISLINVATVKDGILTLIFRNTKGYEIKLTSRKNTKFEIATYYRDKLQNNLIFDSKDYSRHYPDSLRGKRHPEDFLMFNGFPGKVFAKGIEQFP